MKHFTNEDRPPMTSTPTIDAVLDLLSEIQVLDRLPRLGFLQRGMGTAESLSEHLFHVAFLVLVLAPGEPTVDRADALELALVHDLAEVRIGDIPRPAQRYFPENAKSDAEAAALAELLAGLGEDVPARRAATSIHSDAPEARFVRACDRLALLIKVDHYQRCGHGCLDDFWGVPYDSEGFPTLERLHTRLLARRRERS